MKSKFFLLVGVFAMFSSSAFGISTCLSVLSSGTGTFDNLVALGSTGCDVGDVTFNDFNTTYTASSVLTQVNGVASSPIGSILGFTYNGTSGALGTGTIGYTATFDPNAATDGAGGVACPGGSTICGISGLETQLNALLVGGTETLATVNTIYTSSGGGSCSESPSSASVSNSTLGSETFQGLTTSLLVSPCGVTKEASYTFTGTNTINTYSTEVITGSISGVPEPTSMLLLGTGLLGLGFIKRRASRKS